MIEASDSTQTLNRADSAGSFAAILGILSALGYPIFALVWNGEPIGAGKYAALLTIFGALFLALVFISEKGVFRSLLPIYVNWAMPAFYVAAALAAGGILSASNYLIASLLIHAAVPPACFVANRLSLNVSSFNCVSQKVLSVLPVGYAVIFWAWLNKAYRLDHPQNLPAWGWALAGVAFALIGAVLLEHGHKKMPARWRWTVYAAAVFLTVGLVYRPELFADRWHYNYLLSPINDMAHGKIPFVNTTSQYGIGAIYALMLAFGALRLPLSYEGLAFILAILYILQYLWLAAIVWKATDDLAFGIVGLLAVIYFNYLTVYWQSILRFPGHSPLRYGLTYLLLGVALLNLKNPRRFLTALEFLLIGAASVWSFEAFAYALVSLDAFYFVSDALSAPEFSGGIKKFAKRLALQSAVVLAAWTALEVYAYAMSGGFPDFNIYRSYYELQWTMMPENLKTLPLQMWLSGSVMFVYLFTLFAVAYDRIRRTDFLPPAAAALLAGIAVAGIVQYVYYLVFYFDFHFALMCVPLIVTLTLWAAVVRQNAAVPPLLRIGALTLTFVSLAAGMVLTSANFYNKFSKSLFYVAAFGQRSAFKNPYRVAPSNKVVALTVDLVRKYAGDQEAIAIFIEPDDQAEVLFLTGKVELLGMSEADMSAVSPVYSEYALNNARAFAGKPAYIFYCSVEKCLIPLQEEAYRIMVADGNYKVVDEKRGVLVLKKSE